MLNHNLIDTATSLNNRQHLRAAVQANHAMAEQAWIRDGKFLSHGSYLDFLRALLRAHVSIGLPSALHRRSATELALERARIAALETDLATRAGVVSESLILSKSYAWGVAYVLNGSCLGAALLLKSDAVDPGWPSTYLRLSQSCAASGRLKTFFGDLNAAVLNRPDAVVGARDVFTLISGAPSPILQDETTWLGSDACRPS